jgi:hypothetical protein
MIDRKTWLDRELTTAQRFADLLADLESYQRIAGQSVIRHGETLSTARVRWQRTADSLRTEQVRA